MLAYAASATYTGREMGGDGGTGRSFVALENVELLELRAAGGADFASGEPREAPADTALATLRVTVRQAVYLTAAENFGHEVALKRPGQPGELAPAYVYLASSDSSYVTGALIEVTGGRLSSA